jgi:hypothetical protein
MKCGFFTGKFMMTCKANANVYVPSSFEMQEYCGSIRHKVCPFYSRAKNLEQRLLLSAQGTPIFTTGRQVEGA